MTKSLSPLFFIFFLALASPALAGDADPDQNGIPEGSVSKALKLDESQRKILFDRGVYYTFAYTNDLLSNLHGGQKRGTVDQGKLEAAIAFDFEKMAGLEGLSAYSNGFLIYNNGRMRRDYVGGINTIAAIEAVPKLRLSELWIEKKWPAINLSLRAGQLAADTEFFFSEQSPLFLQSDWPTIAAANMPSGGPAYPFATPGVRLKFEPTKEISFLAALFNGDAAGAGSGDEQVRNKHGLNFRMNDRPLAMLEAQFRKPPTEDSDALGAIYKIGVWNHFGNFADQRFSANGAMLANPANTAGAAIRRGEYGVYGVIDQQVFRNKDGKPEDGIWLFGRIAASPNDRSLVSFFLDGGLVFAGLIDARPNDKFGVSAIYSRYSNSARGFDRDSVYLYGGTGPIRDFETNVEFSYAAQIVPGWTIQPLMTLIFHPSGDKSRNATLIGARSFLRF